MAGSTVRGLSWSLASAVGQAVLQMLALVVLSRLVTVQQFGIVVAATVVVSFALMLGQLGVGPALVQARRLDDDDIATACYVAAGLGTLLAGGLVVLAPLVGGLVGLPPGSSYLLRLLSVTLVLGSVSAVAVGLLQRQMRFRGLAAIELGSYGVGYLGTGVLLAHAGAGAAALVWAQIAQSVLSTAGFYALARPDVRPRPLATMAGSARKIFGFGSGYSLAQLGNWFGNNGDNLVISTTVGPAALGIYSRAYQLLVQPANLVGAVADKVLFPSMARIQDDLPRLARAYVVVNALVAVVTVPASVLLFLLAPEVVAILLGPDWSAVTVPLQVFAVVLLPRTAYKISGSLTRATGAVFGAAWRQWLYAAEVVLGCLIGSTWGVIGVAVGASVAIVLHCATMLVFSARIRSGLVRSVLAAYAKSLPAAAVTVGVCAPLAHALRGSTPAVVTVLVTTAVAMLCSAVVLVGMRRWYREEVGMLSSAVRRPQRLGSA
jgi:O-antigen/teichoic acid export membrane protein